MPPLAVELGGDDHVVIDRPERVVAESFVVALDLVLGQGHGMQPHARLVKGLRRLAGLAGPPHPDTVAPAHDGLHGRHEAAGAAVPLDLPVLADDAVHGEAVGCDHEVVPCGGVRHGAISSSGVARVVVVRLGILACGPGVV